MNMNLNFCSCKSIKLQCRMCKRSTQYAQIDKKILSVIIIGTEDNGY